MNSSTFVLLVLCSLTTLLNALPTSIDHMQHVHDSPFPSHPSYKQHFDNVVSFDFDYEIDGVLYEGFFAHPTDVTGQLPGAMIAHQWMGLQAYEKFRAEQWASFGYVAFASDVYGKGIRPTNPNDARGNATFLRENPDILRQRAAGGLRTLATFNFTDPSKIVQFGYCFGGSTVLELARDGADIKATATFHGSLYQLIDDPNRNNILGAVAVHHGDADTSILEPEVDAFVEEMRSNDYDWHLVSYGGAAHGFSEASSPAYDEKADIRSLAFTIDFFKDILNL